MTSKELIKLALEIADLPPMYRRPVSATFGRVFDPVTALLLGTITPLKGTAHAEDPKIKEVLDAFEDVGELEDTKVYFGRAPFFAQFPRIWKNKDISILSKLYGTATTPASVLLQNLLRASGYSPFSKIISLYQKDPAIFSHELGHALDFERRKYPGAYAVLRTFYPIQLYQEAKATLYGLDKRLDMMLKKEKLDKEDIKELGRMNRVLTAAFATYVGAVGGLLGQLSVFPGQLIGQTLKPFVIFSKNLREKYEKVKEKYRKQKK